MPPTKKAETAAVRKINTAFKIMAKAMQHFQEVCSKQGLPASKVVMRLKYDLKKKQVRRSIRVTYLRKKSHGSRRQPQNR